MKYNSLLLIPYNCLCSSVFPFTSTWKAVKDTPNYVLMSMIGLAQTSLKILEDGDVPIFSVVLITPDSPQLTLLVMVSHYPPSTRRLLQYIYDRTFSAIARHSLLWLEVY